MKMVSIKAKNHLHMNYIVFFTTILIINISVSICSPIHNVTFDQSINSKTDRSTFYISYLDVLYIIPEKVDDVLSLNEVNTFGGGFKNGWILPSDVPLNLNLYIYYDGKNEQKIDEFFDINKNKENTGSSYEVQNEDEDYQVYSPKAHVYMYFTTANQCNEVKSHRPLEITEKIGKNMYKARLKNVVLSYSDSPYYICMEQIDVTQFDTTLQYTKRFFLHQGNDYWNSIITTRQLLPLWSQIALFFGLLCLSALFSGLNLGLMSLDLSELEILMKIGTTAEQGYARKIYPLRKRGNFLLCSILLGNVMVNAISTLILGDMISGIYAAIGSTLLIVCFGEIIPQAVCSRFGLAVGANTIFLMYFFMFVTSPLAFPISKFLDLVLGQELATVYGRDKIRELLKNVEDLNDKEFKIITGALDFNKKK